MRWIVKIAVFLFSLLGIFLLAVWLILSSSFLAKTRGDLTAGFLSEQLGQDVRIGEGVNISLGTVFHVSVERLVLPNGRMPDVNLLEIGQLEFDVALRDLLKRRVELSALEVNGAKVALLVDADGKSSWSSLLSSSLSKSDAQKTEKTGTTVTSVPAMNQNQKLFDYLSDRKIQFSNTELSYENAQNGWEFDLVLSSLGLIQNDQTAPVILAGNGSINGEELELNGNFPPEQPFNASIDFSDASIEFDGSYSLGGSGLGISSAIAIEVSELGQLLDILKLQESISGTGHANAVFERVEGVSSLSDIEVLISVDRGPSIELIGDLGKLPSADDNTMRTNIQLYTQENMPPRAKVRRDLKLTGIDMQFTANPGEKPQRSMIIETNGFDINTTGEGPPPITVSEISRTPEGVLRLGQAELRLGKTEAPFLILQGSIEDALKLEGIDLGATLDLPIANLIAPEYLKSSDDLGAIAGTFRLQGDAKVLGLSDLHATSHGTDLWHLDVSGSLKNALNFGDVSLEVGVEVPSGAALLSAMKLEPVETGAVSMNTKMSSEGLVWQSTATVSVAKSQLTFSSKVNLGEPNPTVRGLIESDFINVTDLRDVVASALQIRRLGYLEDTAKGGPPSNVPTERKSKIKPLVLESTEDKTLVKPLVLETAETNDPETPGNETEVRPITNVSLQPLGQAILLSGMDVSVSIDLRKIEGENGISSLKSDLEMKDQKARLGPVKFEYGGASFDISGSIDLAKKTDTVRLTGSAGGWNFADIMHQLKFKKYASGILYANFDVTGSHTSLTEFIQNLNGNADISLKNGSIDTQLLDLAGLGVLPWLFSKDRGDVTTIVCARAPLHISNGRITTKQFVVETGQVQVVVYGDVDLKDRSIDIAGQPRRIGKPLSRSPWPFTATGPFANPKIKVKDGPRRLKRSDGASTMPRRRKICIPDILQLK